jgi:hypothetical protein
MEKSALRKASERGSPKSGGITPEHLRAVADIIKALALVMYVLLHGQPVSELPATGVHAERSADTTKRP